MGRPKRKPRPSMPHHYWLDQDGCWFCDRRNNCSHCKANREASKNNQQFERKRDKQQKLREYDE